MIETERKISQVIDEKQLEQVSGGAEGISERFTEVFCPKCGCVTQAYPLSSRLYSCTVCHRRHSGERALAAPRE